MRVSPIQVGYALCMVDNPHLWGLSLMNYKNLTWYAAIEKHFFCITERRSHLVGLFKKFCILHKIGWLEINMIHRGHSIIIFSVRWGRFHIFRKFILHAQTVTCQADNESNPHSVKVCAWGTVLVLYTRSERSACAALMHCRQNVLASINGLFTLLSFGEYRRIKENTC